MDGSTNNVNGPLTEAVESYGKGIEQAFGDRFADGCRNIDRIARLPGTINTKTGQLARVLHEFSHEEPHAYRRFSAYVRSPRIKRLQSGQFNAADAVRARYARCARIGQVRIQCG